MCGRREAALDVSVCMDRCWCLFLCFNPSSRCINHCFVGLWRSQRGVKSWALLSDIARVKCGKRHWMLDVFMDRCWCPFLCFNPFSHCINHCSVGLWRSQPLSRGCNIGLIFPFFVTPSRDEIYFFNGQTYGAWLHSPWCQFNANAVTFVHYSCSGDRYSHVFIDAATNSGDSPIPL